MLRTIAALVVLVPAVAFGGYGVRYSEDETVAREGSNGAWDGSGVACKSRP